MLPLVSVLILTYNHERFIAQAIDSVLAQQTSFEFEVLIGNDASTDNTGNIVNDRAQRHSQKIVNLSPAKNIGALRNEQQLFKAAKGKYIAFLEGDDFWSDVSKLQMQVDFLEANPDYGLVHGDVDHYYENTGKTEHHVNRLHALTIPSGFVFDALLQPNPLFIKTATVCFRKELVQKYFDFELAIRDNWPLTDLALWMDITQHSKAHYMDQVLATYRLLNESASRSASPEKKLQYHKKLYQMKLHYLDKYNCNNSMRQALEEDYHRNMIKIAFNLDDKQLASESARFLKSRHLAISGKERLMLLSTGKPFLKRAINFIK